MDLLKYNIYTVYKKEKKIIVFKKSLRVLSFYVRYEWSTERFELKTTERLVNW